MVLLCTQFYKYDSTAVFLKTIYYFQRQKLLVSKYLYHIMIYMVIVLNVTYNNSI